MGNHVKLTCFVLLPVSEEEKHDFHFFHSMYNKSIIRIGLCDIQNNQGLGKDYPPRPSASAFNPYPSLMKTLSNNSVYCIVSVFNRASLPGVMAVQPGITSHY